MLIGDMKYSITFLCLLLAGCGKREGPPVKIIVPDNYEIGKEYYIVIDKENGDMPKEENGMFVYDYTEPGKTYRTFKYFRGWHKEYIVTKSGKVIWGADGMIDKSLSVTPTHLSIL